MERNLLIFAAALLLCASIICAVEQKLGQPVPAKKYNCTKTSMTQNPLMGTVCVPEEWYERAYAKMPEIFRQIMTGFETNILSRS